MDYMPSALHARTGGHWLVVFERLDPTTQCGDLYLVPSDAGAASRSAPLPNVASSANERHPAQVETGAGGYALFCVKGSGSTTGYRIWRATSDDGTWFTEQGPLDLGWPTGGEVNLHVIRAAEGTLTMSYQRLSSGSHVARSGNGGAVADRLCTPIVADGQLPRIARRENDGLYLASYPVGASALRIHVKTKTEVCYWSTRVQDSSGTSNHHDGLPVVMPDDAFALFRMRQQGSLFDLAAACQEDGVRWSEPLAGTAAFTIVRAARVPLRVCIFANGFEADAGSVRAPGVGTC